MDPDQDGHSVGPDLGPNCLQSLSIDNKSCRYKLREELTSTSVRIHTFAGN